jgi:hypothetical protein
MKHKMYVRLLLTTQQVVLATMKHKMYVRLLLTTQQESHSRKEFKKKQLKHICVTMYCLQDFLGHKPLAE